MKCYFINFFLRSELGEGICKPHLLGLALVQARLEAGAEVPWEGLALREAPQQETG